MFLLKQILPATILAMVVAAGICGIALAWGTERAKSALAPLAMGVAYFVGHLFIVGWFRIPPSDTTNWLPYFALAAGVLGACCTVVSLSRWTRALIFAVVSAGALTLLLKPKFQYGWSLGQGLIWVAGLMCAVVLLAVILDGLTRRPAQALEMPVILLAACAGTFGALMLSGSVLLAQFAAVLGGAVFGCLVFSARNVALGRGIVPLISLLLGTLLASGYFFAELPAAAAVLLGLAPAFALIPIYPQSKLLGRALEDRFVTLGVRAATVAIPILLALFLAFRASPSLDY